MRLFGLMVVRNEVDILSTNILHHLASGVERFLVIDNGSTDGTTAVLDAFQSAGVLTWRRDEGPPRQAELTTQLAREADQQGAQWVLPIDADEFWYTAGGNLGDVIERYADAAAIRVQLRNYVQRRDEIERRPRALLEMRWRPARVYGPVSEIRELVGSGAISYIEAMYPPKWISRVGAQIEYGIGNHRVYGIDGDRIDTEEIVCLHAPLRARDVLETKMVDHGARVVAMGLKAHLWWQARRWHALHRQQGVEPEWAANSSRGGYLDVGVERHPLLEDDLLARVCEPHVRG